MALLPDFITKCYFFFHKWNYDKKYDEGMYETPKESETKKKYYGWKIKCEKCGIKKMFIPIVEKYKRGWK